MRVPDDATGSLTTVSGTVGTPGVVQVERHDRTPTIIQVASPGPGRRFVRAAPSPDTATPGFVRPPRAGALQAFPIKVTCLDSHARTRSI
jgi:hypothetical protein